MDSLHALNAISRRERSDAPCLGGSSSGFRDALDLLNRLVKSLDLVPQSSSGLAEYLSELLSTWAARLAPIQVE